METDASAAASASAPDPAATPRGDFAYETFFGAAIGGAVIALFFLLIDALAGQVFFTPSLMGTALISEVPVSAETPVRLDMVALYSVVHFGVFFILGALASKLRGPALSLGGPVVLAGALFLLMTGGFWMAAGTILQRGAASAIGWHWVLAANLLTAIAMTAFVRQVHTAD
jgi:hypothetical protein